MNDDPVPVVGGPAGPPTPPQVVVYGRPDCHLCEQALVVIERVRSRVAFELEQVDIEADETLFKRYLERIPVIVVNGQELFEFFVDERLLESALTGT
jgi:glutaredoxin